MNTLPIKLASRSRRLSSRTSETMKWLKLTGIAVAGALLLIAAAPGITTAAEPVKDLSYGDALFEFYRGDYFASATKLLVAQQQDTLEHHADAAELLLGGLYLSYGQQDAAAIVAAAHRAAFTSRGRAAREDPTEVGAEVGPFERDRRHANAPGEPMTCATTPMKARDTSYSNTKAGPAATSRYPIGLCARTSPP